MRKAIVSRLWCNLPSGLKLLVPLVLFAACREENATKSEQSPVARNLARDTHTACKASGQLSQPLKPPTEIATPGNPMLDIIGGAPENPFGLLLSLSPLQIELQAKGSTRFMTATLSTSQLDDLQYGDYVEFSSAMQGPMGESHGVRRELRAIKRVQDTASQTWSLLRYRPVGGRELVIFHDGTVRYGEESHAPIDSERLTALLQEFSSSRLNDAEPVAPDSMDAIVLSCYRLQAVKRDAIPKVRAALDSFIRELDRHVTYRLQYDERQLAKFVPWPEDLIPLARLSRRESIRELRDDRPLPQEVLDVLPRSFVLHHLPQPTVYFEDRGILYLVERNGLRTDTKDIQILDVRECSLDELYCKRLPEDFDLANAGQAGLVVDRLRLEAMKLLPAEHLSEQNHGSVLIDERYVYRGISTSRQMMKPLLRTIQMSSARVSLLQWPADAPSLTSLWREKVPGTIPKALESALRAVRTSYACDGEVCMRLRWNRAGKNEWGAVEVRPIHGEFVRMPKETHDLSSLEVGKSAEVPLAQYEKHQRVFDRIRRSRGITIIQGGFLYRFVSVE